MKEKVLNLLSLCLTAKEQGVCIWFYYSPHIDAISIYALKDEWEAAPPDEVPERYFDFTIYLDWGNTEERIVAVEQAIKNLIDGRNLE